MHLSPEQIRIASAIDAKVEQLIAAGCDDTAVLAEMYEEMPNFKRLLDTAGHDGMDALCVRFPSFYRYAKILENLAAGIKSGRIKVPK